MTVKESTCTALGGGADCSCLIGSSSLLELCNVIKPQWKCGLKTEPKLTPKLKKTAATPSSLCLVLVLENLPTDGQYLTNTRFHMSLLCLMSSWTSPINLERASTISGSSCEWVWWENTRCHMHTQVHTHIRRITLPLPWSSADVNLV